MKEYVGDFYKVASTGDVIYIVADLPSEYSGSKYTHSIKGTNAKAKANAASGLSEIIETASGQHFRKNQIKEMPQMAGIDIIRILQCLCMMTMEM